MVARPTLLLLHGGPGGDHSLFKPLFGQLADVAQVVYLDQRGHGRSAAGVPSEWTLDTWADDVHDFCAALGIERPLVLGMSFGGMVAMRYAAKYPSHPGALILASTFARRNDKRVEEAFGRRGGPEAERAAAAFFRDPSGAVADYVRICMPLYYTGGGNPTANARQIIHLEIALHFIGGENTTMDLLADLRRVTCPVQLIAGEDDPIVPVDQMLDIQRALTNAEVRLDVVTGAGHGVYVDAPDVFIDLVRSFIANAQISAL
jgi:proline iminopeptidase